MQVIGGLSPQQSTTTSLKSSYGSNTARHNNQRREASGRIIKSILLNKDTTRQSRSTVHSSEHQQQIQERDKRPPRPSLFLKDTNGEDKIIVGNNNDLHVFSNEKQQEKRSMRNKDRPDRGVWTPLRRSEGSHASNESLSSSTSQTAPSLLDSAEGIC